MSILHEAEEPKAYAEILEARVAYVKSKFNMGLATFVFCCVLFMVWLTGFAVITLIHLWRVWV